jgi:hypothetical protein
MVGSSFPPSTRSIKGLNAYKKYLNNKHERMKVQTSLPCSWLLVEQIVTPVVEIFSSINHIFVTFGPDQSFENHFPFSRCWKGSCKCLNIAAFSLTRRLNLFGFLGSSFHQQKNPLRKGDRNAGSQRSDCWPMVSRKALSKSNSVLILYWSQQVLSGKQSRQILISRHFQRLSP